MVDKIIFKIEKDTLIIEKTPNNCIDIEAIEQICCKTGISKFKLKKIVIGEGIDNIGGFAFEGCESLRHINISNSVKEIGNYAFKGCKSLKKIIIPGGVLKIRDNAFLNCENLSEIIFENGIKEIGENAFACCGKLINVELPNTIDFIGDGAFCACKSLRNINIPEGVTELNDTFYDCFHLKNVKLPNTLEVINNSTFQACYNLKHINIPSSVTVIGNNAFCGTGLTHIEIPSSVKIIGMTAFAYSKLYRITINEGLKEISHNSFYECVNLSSVNLPNSVEKLGDDAFNRCFNLKHIKLSNKLNCINNRLLSHCYSLKNIEIPEGITSINSSFFDYCKKLKKIVFPSTLEFFYYDGDGAEGKHLNELVFVCKDGEKTIDFTYGRFIENKDNILYVYDSEKRKYAFYSKGEFIEFNEHFLSQNKYIKNLIDSRYVCESDYIKLYYWVNKKIIPSTSVIKTMPIDDIDNFFVNKNCNEWAKLVKLGKYSDVEQVSSFFKLCYVLGVFNESTTIRDNAVNFIRENIIGKLNGSYIHARFDGFDLNNGFNKEYAEFFIKYYKGKGFMIYVDEDDDKIDLMAASYNNFKNVKKVYPNKTLYTNRDADLLLPEHVMNAVGTREYVYIDEGNEEFALAVGRYGYTQQQFEKLQDWYNKGKEIKEMKLFISEDKEINGITYKLLSKDDPRGAILGNITNCCQIIDGAGQSCVEYGMTNPNSGFITFNYKSKIIGQAWVWYDEVSKTVCLDNIEIPHRYLEKINQNKTIQKSFIDCLLRMEKGFKEDMNKRGLKVDKVTIGEGYNDIRSILNNSFKLNSDTSKLSGYHGYSDASSQYVISRVEKSNKR